MSLTDVQTILSVAAPLSVIIGVIIALIQLRNQNRLRQLELVMRLYASFEQDEFVRHYFRLTSWKYKTYKAYRRRHSQEDSVSLFVVGAWFETMGLLLKRRLASIELLDDLLSGPILQTWPKVRPVAIGLREELQHPAWFEWFEFLYERMRLRVERMNPKAGPAKSRPA